MKGSSVDAESFMSDEVARRESAERRGQAQPAAAPADVWRHPSGILLPRGTVVSCQATEAELDELERRSQDRGVREHAHVARHVKRSASEERQLQEFCQWLQGHGLDILGSVTFTDEYAARHCVYSLKRAIDDVHAGLRDIRMKRGSLQGFRGKFVMAGEWHPSGREVPHVHLVLDSMGAPIENVCTDLWQYFYLTRGRSRFEPMRDTSVATLYGLKDTIKSGVIDPDSMRLRLSRPRCSRGRR